MQDYNEDIIELIKLTKLLHKEVKRLNSKIRNEKLGKILKSIPQKTILYDGNQLKNFTSNYKIDNNNKIVIKFDE